MAVKYDRENDCLVYDRKLKDGLGDSLYGLEVCKSLNLPEEFLNNANIIRLKYHTKISSCLDKQNSHYNSSHLKGGICEMCNKNEAIDVHHLIYQEDANEKGIIEKHDGLIFQKNNAANLLNICKECHDNVHKKGKRIKKTKTTKGMILSEI
jgi:DNA mismatch repair protein MutS